MDVALVAIVIASPLIAFAVGRWWTLVLPIAALVILYTGLNAGWWGHGVGDGWQFAMLLFVGLGVLAAALGVWARRALVARTSARP